MFQFSLKMMLEKKLVHIHQPWLPEGNDRRDVVGIIQEMGFNVITTKNVMVPLAGRLKEAVIEYTGSGK